ncbi:hypothetical protein C5S29_10040 [ANME-1 cluster archaeon GoMg3.2]|nr:hypothetical protein [ANME-1 cluster archaeon GoMg3.2]
MYLDDKLVKVSNESFEDMKYLDITGYMAAINTDGIIPSASRGAYAALYIPTAASPFKMESITVSI